MALFPSRPTLELYVPEPLFVGRPATFEVEITANDETKIESIDFVVRGKQGWRVGSGKSTVTNHAIFPEEGRRLAGPGTLAAGTKQRFSTQLTLPAGTAPSHELHPAWAKLELEIRVGIPWWPDAKATYYAQARVLPPSEIVRTPSIGQSRVASADDARLEISLASTNLIAGEILVGACAAFHMDDRKPREVDIELVPHLGLHRGGRVRQRRADALAVTVTLPAGSAGDAVPFQIALPENMTPSFQTVTHELSWYLVATTGSVFSGTTEVMLPLAIFDRIGAAHTPKLASPPQLGDEKVTALFTRFAAKHGFCLLPESGTEVGIAGEYSKSVIDLGYSYRGKDGAFLVSRVHHPSLGLGLSVSPSSTLRHLFFEDLEVDIAAWDRAHRATARSRDQALPFLKAAVPSLIEVGQLGKLVRWDDDLAVFERDVTDIDEKLLNDTRLLLQFVAKAIEHDRESIMPPPGGLGVDPLAWRALAERLGGELAIGELSIDGGRLDGEAVELGLVFDTDGEPRELRVAVGSTDSAGAALRQLNWKLARPASDVLGASVAPSIVERITRWPSNVVDLVVENGIARATVRLDGPRHPDDLGTLIESMVAIRAELDPDRGLYR